MEEKVLSFFWSCCYYPLVERFALDPLNVRHVVEPFAVNIERCENIVLDIMDMLSLFLR